MKPDMAALGRKGGNATKARLDADPSYYARIGALGGKRTAAARNGDPKIKAARAAAGKKGAQRLRELVAAGRTIEALTR